MECFSGIPYTKPIFWFSGLHPAALPAQPRFVSTNPTPGDLPSWFPFSIDVESLDTVLDVCQSHSKCCWPRTLIEARVAEADIRVTNATITKNHPSFPKTTSMPFQKTCISSSLVKASCVVCTPAEATMRCQLAAFLKAVYASQGETSSRSKSNTHRILFKNQLPPVLRFNKASNAITYTIIGALKLTHKEPDLCGNVAKAPSCFGPDKVAEHKRDILKKFPMMLAIAPNRACASYLRSHPPSTTSSRSSSAKPQLLLLKEFRLKSKPNDAAEKAEEGLQNGDGSVGAVWEGIYSTFTWVLSPGAHETNPPHPPSALPKDSSPTRKAGSTGSAVDEVATASVKKDALPSFSSGSSPLEGGKPAYEGLRIGFDIFASYFHNKRDHKKALRMLMALTNRTESRLEKKLRRFGVGLMSTIPATSAALPRISPVDRTDSVPYLRTAAYMHRLPSFIKFLDSHCEDDDGHLDQDDAMLLSSRSSSNSPIPSTEASLSRKHRRPLSEEPSLCSVGKRANSREADAAGFTNREARLEDVGANGRLEKVTDAAVRANRTCENYSKMFPRCPEQRLTKRAQLVCVGFLSASGVVPTEVCQHPNAILLYNVLPQNLVFPLRITSIHGTEKKLEPLDNLLTLANALLE